ncbi:MAG: ribosome maturation factor RimM [Aquabacterium sp.]
MPDHGPTAPLAGPQLVAEGRPQDAVDVGRVVGSWGVRGAVRVAPLSGKPLALLSARTWHLSREPRPGQSSVPAVVQVTSARPQGDSVVAHLEGFADRDAAQSLAGAVIHVGRSTFPAPDPDEYYWVDLIGLAVVNRDLVQLGVVVGLIDTGVHSVLRVQDATSGDKPQERLIPFVSAYVDAVERAEGRIRVDWGLDY